MKKTHTLSFLILFSFLCISLLFPSPSYAQSGYDLDSNGDGKIDGIEFGVWLAHYNTTTPNKGKAGDFNIDTRVDGVDFSVWLANYGRTIATPTRVLTPTSSIPTATRPPGTPTPSICYVKVAGYVYNMQPAVGIKIIDPPTNKSNTHSRGDFRCGTLANPTDVTAVYLDKHDKFGCAQRIAQYIVTPPAPVDPTCPL